MNAYLSNVFQYEAKEWMEALAILDQGPINLFVSLDLERNALQTDMPSENVSPFEIRSYHKVSFRL